MIHIFLGTKAQLVKMAPVMMELDQRGIPYNFIHSGQHQETIGDLLDDFNLRQPDSVLHEGEDITSIGSMAVWLSGILRRHGASSPIWRGDRNGVVLVHGDTFSTLAGALLARRSGLKVAHVEAGLRSFNVFSPFPEELTRLAVFRLSDYLFCPGEWACENLKSVKGSVINTDGNTLIDSIRHFLACEQSDHHIPDEPYALVSIHRFENIFRKKKLFWIVDRIIEIAKTRKVLFILHPPTAKKLRQFDLDKTLKDAGVELRPRYGYLDFIALLNRSDFLITDGGSNQEESSYLGKPCLLMRQTTERTEGVGENVVLSRYDSKIIDDFLTHFPDHRKTPLLQTHYPSRAIVDALSDFY